MFANGDVRDLVYMLMKEGSLSGVSDRTLNYIENGYLSRWPWGTDNVL